MARTSACAPTTRSTTTRRRHSAIMRPGIRTFNESIGGQNTATSGYHETITRLWVMAIAAHLRAIRCQEPVGGLVFGRRAVRRTRESCCRQCYSFDVVADTRARAEWVPPDRPAPWGQGIGESGNTGIGVA